MLMEENPRGFEFGIGYIGPMRVDRRIAGGLVAVAVTGFAWVLMGVGVSPDEPNETADPLPASPDDKPVSFGNEVLPILARSCLACHGFDPSTRKADLRLDTYEFATAPRRHGAAIVPGDPRASLILERVSHADPEERMPPEGEPLKPAEIEILTRWIAQGAPYEKHWSLRPVTYTEAPVVGEPEWERNPIDAFVRARQIEAGLEPAPEADRRTLLRRLSFDLTGLPPTPEEIDAFVRDDSPDAYEKQVDRLLASPRFGERWARHWLDLMRYAETYAHEYDYPIRHAYQYRDYVIRALNADVPYDQFVIEHLAGDLLAEPRLNPEHGYNESIIGTSFWWLSQGTHAPVDVLQDEAERLDNQIDVMSKAFLATTVSCARCHDHKFDPIYTREYYGLTAFIQSSRRQEAYLDPDQRITTALGEMRECDALARAALTNEARALGEGTAPLLLATAEVLYADPHDGEDAGVRARTFATFDSLTYEGWTVEGDAFTDRPTEVGDDPLDSANTARGEGFANTHRRLGNDGSVEADERVGKLTSEPFTIEHDYLHFLIGGGNHPGKTGLRVVVDGKAVRDATGINALHLVPRRFDLSQFRGREAHIEIFDEVTGGWGNIRVDELVFSDEPRLDLPVRRPIETVAQERGLDAEQVRRWVRAVQSVGVDDSRHVMSPWLAACRAAHDGSPVGDAIARATSDDGSATANALFDFGAGVMPYDEWFETGWAFGGSLRERGAWREPADEAGVGVIDAADSGRLSDRLMGTLRSPTFEIAEPYLAVLVRGRGTVRVIIDGYTHDEYNALLWGGVKLDLDSPSWAWHLHDLRKWIGHRAHYEIIDDRQNASVEIARAVWRPEYNRPASLGLGEGIAHGAAPDTLEPLAQIYADGAARASQGECASWADAAMLEWLVATGLVDTTPAAEVRERFAKAERDCPAPMRALTMEDGTGEDARVYVRGNSRTLGDDAPRAFIAAFCADPSLDIPEGSGRLQLAHKLLDESDPLPSRVMVNRVWHYLFGRGIVPTPDDFGLLGKTPTHPDLLDHLAWRFDHEMDWSTKTLIREVVTSRTYRTASGELSEHAEQVDPLNELLSVRDIRRLDGESIRDAILIDSGRLDETMYGPSIAVHVTPFMTGRGRPGRSGPVDGDGRRSVYLEVRRNFLNPMMQTFDAPNPHSTIGKRSDSNVPAQSLILLNDPFVAGEAKRLASLILSEDATPESHVDTLYRRTLGRPPTAHETELALAFLRQQATTVGGGGDAPDWRVDENAWGDLCHVMFNVKEFVFLE